MTPKKFKYIYLSSSNDINTIKDKIIQQLTFFFPCFSNMNLFKISINRIFEIYIVLCRAANTTSVKLSFQIHSLSPLSPTCSPYSSHRPGRLRKHVLPRPHVRTGQDLVSLAPESVEVIRGGLRHCRVGNPLLRPSPRPPN